MCGYFKMLKKREICFVCKKGVDIKKDKYVTLGTFDMEKTLEEQYFHFQCFHKWYNEKVREKSQNTIKDAQGKAMALMEGIMGNMSGTLEQIGILGKEFNKSQTYEIIDEKSQKEKKKGEDKKKEDGKEISK